MGRLLVVGYGRAVGGRAESPGLLSSELLCQRDWTTPGMTERPKRRCLSNQQTAALALVLSARGEADERWSLVRPAGRDEDERDGLSEL